MTHVKKHESFCFNRYKIKNIRLVFINRGIKMDEEPIFKISKYKIAENDLPAFHRVEEAHVTNSIPAEPGTLMIANGHEGVSGVTNYDIELYRNSRAFDIHSMSDYFDAYDNAVEKMAKEKKIWDLKSEWMTTKSKEALNSYADNFVIRLAKVELKRGKHDKFARIVKKEMRNSMAKEPGVEILFAGSNVGNPDEWLFFEVYANNDAYNKHVNTPWFGEYIDDSKDIVENKELHDIVRDTMAVQGPIVME